MSMFLVMGVLPIIMLVMGFPIFVILMTSSVICLVWIMDLPITMVQIELSTEELEMIRATRQEKAKEKSSHAVSPHASNPSSPVTSTEIDKAASRDCDFLSA